MALFRHGFTRGTQSQNVDKISSYLPDQIESGLGEVEYSSVVAAVANDADPEPATKKRKDLR